MSNGNLSAAQFGHGWGTLPDTFKPESPARRRQREDTEYRIARHAEDLQQERETKGHRTEAREYRSQRTTLNYGMVLKERAAR